MFFVILKKKMCVLLCNLIFSCKFTCKMNHLVLFQLFNSLLLQVDHKMSLCISVLSLFIMYLEKKVAMLIMTQIHESVTSLLHTCQTLMHTIYTRACEYTMYCILHEWTCIDCGNCFVFHVK